MPFTRLPSTYHPGATITSVVDELSSVAALDSLEDEAGVSPGVRQSFDWSYRRLSSSASLLLRYLGLHPSPEISYAAADALVETDTSERARAFRQLISSSLLDEPTPGRYRLHDLLRDFAEERAVAEMSEDDRTETERRIAAWYLHTADAADAIIAPQRPRIQIDAIPRPNGVLTFDSRDEAVSWCDTELANLDDVMGRTARRGDHDFTWRFGAVLWNYFYLRKRFDEWEHMTRTGIVAAEALGDPIAKFEMYNGLASAYRHQRRLREALPYYRAALELRDRLADSWTESWLLNNLAEVLRGIGQEQESLQLYGEALRISADAGDSWSQGCFLTNIGEAYAQLGLFSEAIQSYETALPLRRAHNHVYGEGWTCNDLGEAYLALNEMDTAEYWFRKAVQLRRRAGDTYGEAWTLHNIGLMLAAKADFEGAIETLGNALRVRRDIGDRWGVARSADSFARLLASRGDIAEAHALWREAMEIFDETDPMRASAIRQRLGSSEREGEDQIE